MEYSKFVLDNSFLFLGYKCIHKVSGAALGLFWLATTAWIDDFRYWEHFTEHRLQANDRKATLQRSFLLMENFGFAVY